MHKYYKLKDKPSAAEILAHANQANTLNENYFVAWSDGEITTSGTGLIMMGSNPLTGEEGQGFFNGGWAGSKSLHPALVNESTVNTPEEYEEWLKETKFPCRWTYGFSFAAVNTIEDALSIRKAVANDFELREERTSN
jgi:hypothetical protein